MRSRRLLRRSILWMTLGGLGLLLVLPAVAPAQEEVTTSLRRYKDRETSTGYYEDSEVKPWPFRSFLGVPGVVRSPFAYSPQTPEIPHTYLADSHRAVQFYNVQTCVECHTEEARNIHTTRGNLTCRQCHGGEPIASIAHYFSPLNPVRRHAYVCSKCHEGSSASFATYVVHEPKPGVSGNPEDLRLPVLRQLVHVSLGCRHHGLLRRAHRSMGEQGALPRLHRERKKARR